TLKESREKTAVLSTEMSSRTKEVSLGITDKEKEDIQELINQTNKLQNELFELKNNIIQMAATNTLRKIPAQNKKVLEEIANLQQMTSLELIGKYIKNRGIENPDSTIKKLIIEKMGYVPFNDMNAILVIAEFDAPEHFISLTNERLKAQSKIEEQPETIILELNSPQILTQPDIILKRIILTDPTPENLTLFFEKLLTHPSQSYNKILSTFDFQLDGQNIISVLREKAPELDFTNFITQIIKKYFSPDNLTIINTGTHNRELRKEKENEISKIIQIIKKLTSETGASINQEAKLHLISMPIPRYIKDSLVTAFPQELNIIKLEKTPTEYLEKIQTYRQQFSTAPPPLPERNLIKTPPPLPPRDLPEKVAPIISESIQQRSKNLRPLPQVPTPIAKPTTPQPIQPSIEFIATEVIQKEDLKPETPKPAFLQQITKGATLKKVEPRKPFETKSPEGLIAQRLASRRAALEGEPEEEEEEEIEGEEGIETEENDKATGKEDSEKDSE
ncbi:hypothetical protein KAU11_09055, partial [Candidatus Babeliales bacterium]|nr:hypothetical protein [Candidatus Babeliales bacterium]